MRAIVVRTPGDPSVLTLAEVPDPVPGPGEVLLDVAATAVNRADLLQRQGFYPPPPGASEYLGLECSGTVRALGEGVTGWAVGDEVCALLAGGGYAEQVAVPAGQLLPKPSGVSLVDAAGLPETTCTVHSMLFAAGRLQPGETVLVHGGSSGIGTTAIQLAKAIGARVAVTAGSQRKLDACRDLGADILVNYREEKFEDAGFQADVVLDNMGATYLARNLAVLAMDGRVVIVGLQGGRKTELDLSALHAKRASIYGAGLRARPADNKARVVAATREMVWPLIESGQVRPVVDSVFPLAAAADAHRRVESSEHIGKVLIRVGGS